MLKSVLQRFFEAVDRLPQPLRSSANAVLWLALFLLAFLIFEVALPVVAQYAILLLALTVPVIFAAAGLAWLIKRVR
jgi:hypothetical protein